MREFFDVDYSYHPECENQYVATIELWIQADDEEKLPRCYINPRVSLMGEKLTPTWGERRVYGDTGLVYRVGKMVLATELNWELLYMRVDNLLRISTYILSKVRNDNLLQEQNTPAGILREVFEEERPF